MVSMALLSVFFTGAVLQSTHTHTRANLGSIHSHNSEWASDCDRKLGTNAFYERIQFFHNLAICPKLD